MSCPRVSEPQSSDTNISTITSTDSTPPPPPSQCPAKQSPILLAKLQGCPMGYQRQNPGLPQTIIRAPSTTTVEDENVSATLTHPNIPAGTTITAVTRPVQPITRKLESPTDSGIESGSDGSIGKIGSGSSSCSSPRSTLEDGSMGPSLAESLPTLKRALEKPAIFDPHMYHKKFRRCPAGGDFPEGQSQLQTILTCGKSPSYNGMGSSSGLAITHSILAGSLKTAPKMSDEHRKNHEIISRFIDQGGVIKNSKEVLAKIQTSENVTGMSPLNLSKKSVNICEELKNSVEA